MKPSIQKQPNSGLFLHNTVNKFKLLPSKFPLPFALHSAVQKNTQQTHRFDDSPMILDVQGSIS